jgi:histidine triad (HIT) family protein
MSQECTLCKIASGEVKTRVIFEDEHTIGALDIKPRLAKGQCIVFPKNHIERIYDLGDNEAVYLFRAIKEVARRIEKVYKSEHIGLFVRGRTFPHIHVIVFPTLSVTDDILSQFYRSLALYEPLARLSEAELDQVASELKQQ